MTAHDAGTHRPTSKSVTSKADDHQWLHLIYIFEFLTKLLRCMTVRLSKPPRIFSGSAYVIQIEKYISLDLTCLWSASTVAIFAFLKFILKKIIQFMVIQKSCISFFCPHPPCTPFCRLAGCHTGAVARRRSPGADVIPGGSGGRVHRHQTAILQACRFHAFRYRWVGAHRSDAGQRWPRAICAGSSGKPVST